MADHRHRRVHRRGVRLHRHRPEAATRSTYTATHTLLVTEAAQFGGQSLVGTVTFAQVPVFATTGEVPRLVAEELGYDGAPASLAAQLTVEEDAETGTLRFTTEQEDPEEAVRIADAFADETVRYLSLRQEELHQARQTSVLEDVQQLEAEIRDLDQQIADQLAELNADRQPGDPRRGRLDHPGPPRRGGPRVLDGLRGVPLARRRGGPGSQPDDARAGAAGAGADRRVHRAAHTIDARPDRRRHRGAPRRRCRAARRAARRQDPRSPQGRGGVRRRRRRRAADADAQAAGRLVVGPEEHHAAAEAFRSLRTSITFMAAGGQPADDDRVGRARDVAESGRGQDDHRRQPRRGVRRDRAARRSSSTPTSVVRRLEDPHRRAATVAGGARRHRPARPGAVPHPDEDPGCRAARSRPLGGTPADLTRATARSPLRRPGRRPRDRHAATRRHRPSASEFVPVSTRGVARRSDRSDDDPAAKRAGELVAFGGAEQARGGAQRRAPARRRHAYYDYYGGRRSRAFRRRGEGDSTAQTGDARRRLVGVGAPTTSGRRSTSSSIAATSGTENRPSRRRLGLDLRRDDVVDRGPGRSCERVAWAGWRRSPPTSPSSRTACGRGPTPSGWCSSLLPLLRPSALR